jgi:hypothetical protein
MTTVSTTPVMEHYIIKGHPLRPEEGLGSICGRTIAPHHDEAAHYAAPRCPDCLQALAYGLDPDPCDHNGLFSDSPRPFEAHSAYLDRTHRCFDCGADVPNRDL